ncbi:MULTISPECIES: hypothetical protein [unclassified Frankia]|uniref:hypothetical protein n=1 Tax=unclassified Frankia TaxID=2632575 RepID=UPI001EF4B252|nr:MULTISPECIES: hypothetical protein [unclassified Frankia]
MINAFQCRVPGPAIAKDLALLALAVIAGIAVVAPSGPARPVLVLLALLLLPGAAVLTRLDTPDPLTWLGLAIVLSMAVDAGASLVMLWSGLWHPMVLGAVLAAASIAALIVDLYMRLKQAHTCGQRSRTAEN